MLVVILHRHRVGGASGPIKVGDRLIGSEVRSTRNHRIIRAGVAWRETAGRRDHVLAVGQLVLKNRQSDRADVTSAK